MQSASKSPQRHHNMEFRWYPLRDAQSEPLSPGSLEVVLGGPVPGGYDGVDGEIVQKFAMYGARVAIVGDISGRVAMSHSLASFVAKANRGEPLVCAESSGTGRPVQCRESGNEMNHVS